MTKEEKRIRHREYMRTYYAKKKGILREQSQRYPSRQPARRRIVERSYWLKKKYGLTVEQFQEMREAQHDRCAICNQATDRSLNIDHNHATGQVRGLLCNFCNGIVGWFESRPEIMERAVQYLKDYERSR